MADEALNSEVERLRAENEALKKRGLTRRRLRSASGVGLLVLGCGLAALSVVAIWLRVTLLDTDRYVKTVAPIAAEPAVQNAVADRLDTAINSRIDFASLARDVLPERADVLAPVIQTGVQSFIRTRIQEFTRSQRFQDLWTEANRRAHTRITELLVGGRSKRLVLDDDTVYLDLSPAVDRIKTGLQERGLTRIAAAIPPSVDGRIKLVESPALVQAQNGVKLLKAVAIVLPLLALLCLAGSVLLARQRRRGLLRAAIGVALAMLLLVAALGVARSAYLDALGQGALPRDAASDIFDTLAVFLRNGAADRDHRRGRAGARVVPVRAPARPVLERDRHRLAPRVDRRPPQRAADRRRRDRRARAADPRSADRPRGAGHAAARGGRRRAWSPRSGYRPEMPSPRILAPITRVITAMITALLAAIHDLSSSSSFAERSPSTKYMTSGTPTPSVPIDDEDGQRDRLLARVDPVWRRSPPPRRPSAPGSSG